MWLNRVLASMRSTLRRLIPEAVVTYEEKPREQWVFDYPAQVEVASQGWVASSSASPGLGGGEKAQSRGGASAGAEPSRGWHVSLHGHFCPRGLLQVALTCTQIWWTTEVGIAFARLEEGYENAMRDYNKKQVGVPRAWPGAAGGLLGDGRSVTSSFCSSSRALLRSPS